MKSILKDIVDHVAALEGVSLLKITGTPKETLVNSVADDKTVIVSGVFSAPNADLLGEFGMPNLSKLKTILGFSEYDANSVINVTRAKNADGVEVPTCFHFETQTGDFVNDYRLMSKAIIDEKIRPITFKGATWNVEFEPSVMGIMRLKKQFQANSEEPSFIMKVEKGDLKILFGDHSSHSGNLVFHAGVKGNLTKNWLWPAKQFLSIMDLVGDKTIKISDQGVMSIIIDSGLIVYTYLLPAQSK